VDAEVTLNPGSVIEGAGTYRITRTLNVTGGTMAGSGTTQIAAGATANIATKTQDGRTFEIQSQAIVNWNGAAPGSGSWRMRNQATIINRDGGRFNINTNPNRLLDLDRDFGAQPTTSFQNNMGGEIVQTGTGEATIAVHNFNN